MLGHLHVKSTSQKVEPHLFNEIIGWSPTQHPQDKCSYKISISSKEDEKKKKIKIKILHGSTEKPVRKICHMVFGCLAYVYDQLAWVT